MSKLLMGTGAIFIYLSFLLSNSKDPFEDRLKNIIKKTIKVIYIIIVLIVLVSLIIITEQTLLNTVIDILPQNPPGWIMKIHKALVESESPPIATSHPFYNILSIVMILIGGVVVDNVESYGNEKRIVKILLFIFSITLWVFGIFTIGAAHVTPAEGNVLSGYWLKIGEFIKMIMGYLADFAPYIGWYIIPFIILFGVMCLSTLLELFITPRIETSENLVSKVRFVLNTLGVICEIAGLFAPL